MIEALFVVAGVAFGMIPTLFWRHRFYRKLDSLGKDLVSARHEASHDDVTGLLNRSGWRRAAVDLLENAAVEGTTRVAVIMIDLDNFKPINDVHGHAVGDEILRVVAQRLTEVIDPFEVVCRLGGDEFAVLLPVSWSSPVHEAWALMMIRQIEYKLSLPIEVEGKALSVEASVGISLVRTGGRRQADLSSAMHEADQNMYASKRRKAMTIVGGSTVE